MTPGTSQRPPLVREITVKLRELIHSGEGPLQQRIAAEPELVASRGARYARGSRLGAQRDAGGPPGEGTYVWATSEIFGLNSCAEWLQY